MIEKIELLKRVLKEAGLDYVITRNGNTVLQLNVYVGDK